VCTPPTLGMAQELVMCTLLYHPAMRHDHNLICMPHSAEPVRHHDNSPSAAADAICWACCCPSAAAAVTGDGATC
jgi:hypothetical protein